jgi:hypothetical protein
MERAMKLSVTIRGDVDQLRRSYLERRSAIDLELEGLIEGYLREPVPLPESKR